MEMLRGVHIAGDGRGPRRVLLNGRELSGVVYADTDRGIVRIFDDPPKLHRHGKRMVERTARGIVEVFPMEMGA
ncbi:hypothetical protein [Stenotrophomonas maltophilia group sp. Smal13]|uniref:hypothetical protein n=1 Tax=Stenotrophomonas maltophilia group sp. Smal13 TaxID=3377166 RepID=UPI001310E55D|nr:hypothetical protein [Stenotrophomonas maltophilia]